MSGREQQYVQEAFSTNWMTTAGSNLDYLEAEFGRRTGRHCVGTSSGTSAIHLGLRLLGVGPGDEVFGPSLTFVATANPVAYLGATPVFIDSEERTWNMDPEVLREALEAKSKAGRLPKAIVVVHIFGQMAEMDPITKVAAHYGVPILEDAAEALGATYRNQLAGTFGQVSVYSFNGNKMITGTSGGLLLSPDELAAARARKWSQQARDAGMDYNHSELGYNYRLSNLLAGVVRGQLEVLGERISARRAVFERYRQAFASIPGLTPMPNPPDHFHACWLSCFTVDKEAFGMSSRDIIRLLDDANVDSRPVWKPMHKQKLYENHECFGGRIAEKLNLNGICLPSSSSLSDSEQTFVIESIRSMHRKQA